MKLSEAYKKVLDSYKEITKIGELKDCLLDNPSQDSSSFREYIRAHVQRSKESTDSIRKDLEEFLLLSKIFSLE